uniref:3-ketoacyl-[acyl-carrier-protein] reductase beta subunit n=1 Tax=Phocoena sinus TaxID=42100 RepID=A0A8C9EEG6_PHOSS
LSLLRPLPLRSTGSGRAGLAAMAHGPSRSAVLMRSWAAGDHLALSCDVAKEHGVQNTFEEIEKNLGRVNFLVNAAGINRDNLLVRTNAEDMLSQLHTNLLGSVLTCRAAVKTMIKQQTGSVVNSVYSASKGGLVAFSRAFAKEVARKKIRANVAAPVSCIGLPWWGHGFVPRSGKIPWAREPWPLSLHVRSLCSATGEATTVRGPRTAKNKRSRIVAELYQTLSLRLLR